MHRRSFIRLGLAGVTTGIIAPRIVLAGSIGKKIPSSPMAGGIFYTKQSPGRWEKKAGAHLPTIVKTGAGIEVVTAHPMQADKHWIIKHIIFDSEFKYIAENTFDPSKHKKAVSSFDLAGKGGAIYALSVCNLHDSWLSVLEV